MVDSLALMAQNGSDAVTPMWVPILAGAALSFGTFLLSSGDQHWRFSQVLLIESILLSFLLSVLYLIHLLGARSDPLADVGPWAYSLAFLTIALPILAVDLRHRLTNETLAIRLTIAILVPVGIFPLSLIISPTAHTVAAALSLAAFLLLVDALLKVTSKAAEDAGAAPAKESQPSRTGGRAKLSREEEQANLVAIFNSHTERIGRHNEIVERASMANSPEPARRAPLLESPTPAVESTTAPSEPTPLVTPVARVQEEVKPTPVYFTAGHEVSGRISTGIERLDMLLKGGFPSHSQVAIIGPIFIGKEVVLNTFVSAGLATGEQALIITSTRGPAEISKALATYLPDIDALSRSGHLQWIDASVGDSTKAETHSHPAGIGGPGDYEGILSEVARALDAFRGKPFRVAYLSLSNSLTQADERKSFDFLRSLQGVLRDAEVTTLYVVDSGVMDDRQLAELQTMMDGGLLFKREGNRNFLSVVGLGDVVTHQWVEYQRTGKTLTMGSFALERIR